MKRNIILLFVNILIVTLFVFPVGHFLNTYFLNEYGGGFDVGLDNSSINIIIGFLTLPLFSNAILYRLFGGNKKNIWIACISLPFIFLSGWFGIKYLLMSLIFFVFGIFLAFVINKIRTIQNNRPL